MRYEFQNSASRSLDVLLEEAGARIDWRCGGGGRCNRCLVTLIAGVYRYEERTLTQADFPCSIKACRAVLLSDSGIVDVPETSLRPLSGGQIEVNWSARALPVVPEVVVGVDIGTTTVAAVKLINGEVVAKASAFNAQSRFGDNVISRIQYASGGATALKELRDSVLESINQVLMEVGAQEAVRVAVAGNTVMSSLWLGIDPASLGHMPFTPPVRVFPVISGKEAGLTALKGDTPIWTAPVISGFLGGDLSCGLRETHLQPGEMLVDVGTNCEIIFYGAKGLVGSAAAAGPAFEGAGIACGMRALPGALEHYYAPGRYKVIGGGAPIGLCGSALVDVLAVGRRAGFIGEYGRYERGFTGEVAPGISINEAEVATILQAKAAVESGIACMRSQGGGALKRLFLAGGFARGLNLTNAQAIGLLPSDCEIGCVGNTSLAGAVRLAADPEIGIAQLSDLCEQVQEIWLNQLPEFEECFVDSLVLP